MGAASKGIGGHHQTVGRTDEWLTPPSILRRLGPFDLDPCASESQARRRRPFGTAETMYCRNDDGLRFVWSGRVWLNPPYGPAIGEWMKRMSHHGNGIALVFARTETAWFFEHVWTSPTARHVLFIRGRLNFLTAGGTVHNKNAGGPSCLISYGDCEERRMRGMQHSGFGALVAVPGRAP